MDYHNIIIVSFLKSKEKTFSFTQWPNHITVVPYFKVVDVENLVLAVKAVCAHVDSIPYVVGATDYFGVEKNVEVSKLVSNEKLIGLHESLVSVAIQNDPNMDLKFCWQNYKAHITHNDLPYPKEAEKGVLKTLYLVENHSLMTENKNAQVKNILAVVDLAP